MDVSSILASNAAAASSVSSSSSSSRSTLSMDNFYQLLAAQLKYQDPSESTDSTEYMGQMAQFATLEAVNNLSTAFSAMQASQTVGKSVLYNSTDSLGNSTVLSGKVEAVDLSGSTPTCYINGDWVDLSAVTTYYDSSLTSGGTTTASGA